MLMWLVAMAGAAGGVAVPARRVRAPPRSPLGSPFVFGALRLHEARDPSALLTAAWGLGIRAVDTAACYGDGASERAVGAWLRDPRTPADARARAAVVTKGGCGSAADGWAPRLARTALAADVRASLNRLGRIDLFLLHRDDVSRPVGEIVETMAALRGGFRAWGVSNWATDRVGAALDYAAARGVPGPVLASAQDSLARPRHAPWPGTVALTDADRAWYEARGVPVLGWEPLAKGWLAGAWDAPRAEPGPPPPDAPPRAPADVAAWCAFFSTAHPRTRKGGDPRRARRRRARLASAYATRENAARRARLVALARSRGAPPAAVALAYCRARTRHVCVATTDAARLAANVAGAPLSAADVAYLEARAPPSF